MRIDQVLSALLIASAVTVIAMVGGDTVRGHPAADEAASGKAALVEPSPTPETDDSAPAADPPGPVPGSRPPTAGQTSTATPPHPDLAALAAGRDAAQAWLSRHPSSGQTVHLAQANIKQGSPTFAADLATVSARRPDFITLNEAGYRTDAQIRPAGYDAFRSSGSPHLRETPVLWRADRWTRIGAGTRWMTMRRVKWGERAVNWVTLQSTITGKVVSVVSAHPAPTTRATQGLLPVFVARLGALVRQLETRGPVLVGGDFNAAYTSHMYPGAIFAASGLTPTYATFGMPRRGTGDHFGATIDYLFYTTGLTPNSQSTAELHSDHDAVFGTFTLSDPTSPHPTTGQ